MLMLTFTCLKIEGCLPVWCQLKLVPLGVKIVLIIKQLDSYNMHCWVGVLCTLHFANIYYLIKLIMQQLWARSKDDASGHCISLLGMRLSRQLHSLYLHLKWRTWIEQI